MGTLCHIKTVRGYSRCIILRTMANVHTKIQKRQKNFSHQDCARILPNKKFQNHPHNTKKWLIIPQCWTRICSPVNILIGQVEISHIIQYLLCILPRKIGFNFKAVYSRPHKLFGHSRVFIVTIMTYVKRIIFSNDCSSKRLKDRKLKLFS